jgi:uncharacterized protein YcfJ
MSKVKKGGEKQMRTIIGVFNEQSYAQEAIAELQRRDFSPEDISVIMKDKTIDGGTEISRDLSGGVTKGAASGVTTGAVLGGLTGLLVGVGAFVIPGLGAFLVGGPLAAALGLTGAAATTVTGAATGAVAGGVIGALMGLGLTREEATTYEQRIRSGALLLAVPALEEQEDEVVRILERFNATDLTSVSVPTDRIRTAAGAHQIADRDMEYTDGYEPSDYPADYPARSHTTLGAKGGRSALRRTKEEQPRVRSRRRRRIL